MQCQTKKRNGKQCRARALAEKQHCALHADPGRAKELGSKGGRRRTVYRPDALKEFVAPKTAADVRDLLAESIIEIRAGKLDPKVANALGYLGTSLLRALEVADVERRLDLLARQSLREEDMVFQSGDPDGKP
jgi:hypothetical protein